MNDWRKDLTKRGRIVVGALEGAGILLVMIVLMVSDFK